MRSHSRSGMPDPGCGAIPRTNPKCVFSEACVLKLRILGFQPQRGDVQPAQAKGRRINKRLPRPLASWPNTEDGKQKHGGQKDDTRSGIRITTQSRPATSIFLSPIFLFPLTFPVSRAASMIEQTNPIDGTQIRMDQSPFGNFLLASPRDLGRARGTCSA